MPKAREKSGVKWRITVNLYGVSFLVDESVLKLDHDVNDVVAQLCELLKAIKFTF